MMKAKDLARGCDRILRTNTFRDYPGAKNGLQVTHRRAVKKIGWAVDADLASIRQAGKKKIDFLIVHHGLFWGSSALDRKMRARRILESKRLGLAIYSSHLPLDAHPELGNAILLLRVLGLGGWRRERFGRAMGRGVGWRVWGKGVGRGELVRRLKKVTGARVGVVIGGSKICRTIGVVTGAFGDLDQAVKAGLDTLLTGEVDYPTEVKARELGINLILGGHRETEIFGVRAVAGCLSRGLIGGMLGK